MRNIKFRAWDKEENTWVFLTLQELLSTAYKDIGGVFLELDYKSLGQYTGLKDKHGKEIYEGDIVQEKNESGVFKYQIVWHEYDCAFYPKALFKTMIEQRMSSNYTEFEISGDIYENPELLK